MSDPIFTHPSAPPDSPAAGAAAIPPPLPSAARAPAPAVPSITPSGRLCDPTVTHDQRTYAILMHASIVLLHVIFMLSFIVPLAMWLARRQQSRFLDDHGRETLNFHLTIALYGIVSFALIPACGIGFGFLVSTYILAMVGGVKACVASSRAEYFRYPMCIRFVT